MAVPAGSSSRQCQLMAGEASDPAGPGDAGQPTGAGVPRTPARGPASARGAGHQGDRDPGVGHQPGDERRHLAERRGHVLQQQERAGHHEQRPGHQSPADGGPHRGHDRERRGEEEQRQRAGRRVAGGEDRSRRRCRRPRARTGRCARRDHRQPDAAEQTRATAPASASPAPRPRTAPTTAIVAARKNTAARSSSTKVVCSRPRWRGGLAAAARPVWRSRPRRGRRPTRRSARGRTGAG